MWICNEVSNFNSKSSKMTLSAGFGGRFRVPDGHACPKASVKFGLGTVKFGLGTVKFRLGTVKLGLGTVKFGFFEIPVNLAPFRNGRCHETRRPGPNPRALQSRRRRRSCSRRELCPGHQKKQSQNGRPRSQHACYRCQAFRRALLPPRFRVSMKTQLYPPEIANLSLRIVCHNTPEPSRLLGF